jgi:branched-chain amino acid transport system substrate-binding protein
MMKRLKFVFVGLGALALWATTVLAVAEELKIGAIGSLSGGGTAWGLATQRGVQIAIDEVLKEGGLKVGGKTYEPKLSMIDDAYSATGGRTAAERLVNAEHVKFILGPIGSPSVLGALPVTTKAGVLMLSDGFARTILQNPEHAPYNFRVVLSNVEFSPSMVSWIRKEKPTLKKVGLIYPNDAVGQAVIPVLTAAYKSQGFEVWSEGYERGSKEFAPLIAKMLAQKVDLMDLNSNAPGEAGLLVRQARQGGYDKTIWQVGGPSVDEIISIAGPYAEGFMSYDVIDFQDPNAAKFAQAYRAAYSDGVINAYAPAFYNAAKILFKAIQNAGTVTDVTKVRDAVENLAGYDPGIYGPVVWGGKSEYGVNHQLLTKFWIKEVRNGKAVTRATITAH